MEDVADGEMVFMAVDWVVGEVQGRVNGDGLRGRIEVLERSQVSHAKRDGRSGILIHDVMCRKHTKPSYGSWRPTNSRFKTAKHTARPLQRYRKIPQDGGTPRSNSSRWKKRSRRK